MLSNGEVEGPADHASQRPRARNIDWVPRPQTTHASRPPPTIVRGRLRDKADSDADLLGLRQVEDLSKRLTVKLRADCLKRHNFRLTTRRLCRCGGNTDNILCKHEPGLIGGRQRTHHAAVTLCEGL